MLFNADAICCIRLKSTIPRKYVTEVRLKNLAVLHGIGAACTDTVSISC